MTYQAGPQNSVRTKKVDHKIYSYIGVKYSTYKMIIQKYYQVASVADYLQINETIL